MGRETIRKIASGRTRTPHERNLRALGALFLEWYPGGKRTGRLAESADPPVTGWPARVKAMLPGGREAADDEIRALHALLERHADEAPAWSGALVEMMRGLVEAAYTGETTYAQAKRSRRKQKRRPPGDQG